MFQVRLFIIITHYQKKQKRSFMLQVHLFIIIHYQKMEKIVNVASLFVHRNNSLPENGKRLFMLQVHLFIVITHYQKTE
jgi:hypothetical protein